MDMILNIEDLQFSWPKAQVPVLKIPSFKIHRGERVFLQGPSGSGKSTLLNLIGGVLTPQKGKVSVLNQSLQSMSSKERDQFRGDHMGFIFQMFNLLPYLNVLENITLPCYFSIKKLKSIQGTSKDIEVEAKRLLTELGLKEDNLLDKKITQLSVGQQQRVATARALIGKPELIIADEPTSALDADTRAAFLSLLLQECEQNGSTILFVSHDAFVGQFFDRTVQLAEINQL